MCFTRVGEQFRPDWSIRFDIMQLDFGRPVGEGHPPFIIAALDGRELATIERALAAIDAAADSRCDAIKLARMPWGWSTRLFARAEQRGLVMLATALDEESVA